MKKCIAMLLIAVLILCGMPITTMAKTPPNAVDIGLDCLGAAFDLTKSQELLRINTKSIIDADKVKFSDLTYGMQSGARTYAKYYSGKDIASYAQEAGITLSSEISEKINAGTLFKLDLSAKISANVKSAYSSSVESYFSTFKVTRKVGINKMQLDTQKDYEELRSVLNEQFLTALLAADTETEINALFDRFGTHFIAAYSLGGWAEATTTTINTSSTIKNELEQAFSTSADTEANSGAYGAGLSIAISTQENIKSEYNTDIYKTSTYNEVFGGTGGMNFSDASAANSVYNNWVSTIDPFNSATTEIIVDENMQLIGIWDLLPKSNNVQVAKMKQVFINRLTSFNNSFMNTFVYSGRSIDNVTPLKTDLLANDSTIRNNNPEGYIPIYSIAQFAAIGTGDYSLNGKYILMNDLDFAGASFSPIGGSNGTSFTGILDGNGFAIKNVKNSLSVTSLGIHCYGLIGKNSGVIQNLKIDNYQTTITFEVPGFTETATSHDFGVICGYNAGTIQNCQVNNSKIDIIYTLGAEVSVSSSLNLGGIAGSNIGTISFASVKNTTTKASSEHIFCKATQALSVICGGIAGVSTGIITDCNTESCTLYGYCSGFDAGDFISHAIIYSYCHLGDIIGCCLSGTNTKVTRCFSIANTKTATHNKGNADNVYESVLGQITGYCDPTAATKVTDCYYMQSSSYGSCSSNSGAIATIPEECTYLQSLQSVKNTFIENGWTMGSDERYPTFDVSKKTHYFVIVSPLLFNDIYAGSILPNDLKIYFIEDVPAFGSCKDVTKDALIAYDFSDKYKGNIQIAYYQDEVLYTGKIEIDMTQIRIDSIEIEETPSDTQYQIGDMFSSDGIVLKANYNNGSYGYITDDIVTNLDNSVLTESGEKTVTVTYDGKRTTFTITCFDCIGTNNHSPAEGVKENVIEPTCTTDGSCDTVVYCTVCNKKLSSTPTVLPSPGHTEEVIPGKAATCTATGLTDGKKCTVCGETTLAQTVLAKKEHSKTTINQIPATATEDGYTGDVICSVCDELLAEGKVIPATGEQNNCSHMCHQSGFMGFIWKIFKIFWKLFGMNPVCECGAAHY